MRILTWNINSVRLRLPLLLKLLAAQKPDIVCLQETKTQDAFFPSAALADAGFQHQAIWGMKSYNGVAILSRTALADITMHERVGRADCRHLSAKLANGLVLHNLYIPAGGDVPDTALNDKFAHKLAFVDELTGLAKTWRKKDFIAVGDFNIAPYEHDVWSHKQLLDVVSHTPIEVEKLLAWQKALKATDVARHFVPHTEKLYSWWSYRAADWQASNRGRRLDHIWVADSLKPQLKAITHLSPVRGWPQTSDHVPVIADIAA